MQHLQSALGVVALLAFAWAISENRRAVDWKQHGRGARSLPSSTAVLLLEVPQIKTAFALVNRAVDGDRRRDPGRHRPSCSAMSAAAPCPSS